MSVIVIDPGAPHVGRAAFDEDGEPRAADEITQGRALVELDETPSVTLLIIESYRLDPDRAGSQMRSSMPVPEFIGRLKQVAERRGIPVRMQEPPCKNVAYRCPWRFMITAKNRHARDAQAHGVYYFGMEKRAYPKPS